MDLMTIMNQEEESEIQSEVDSYDSSEDVTQPAVNQHEKNSQPLGMVPSKKCKRAIEALNS